MNGFETFAIFVERVVKRPGVSVRVTDEQELGIFGGDDATDGVVDELVDSGCFVDDDEDVSGVESLESVLGVG